MKKFLFLILLLVVTACSSDTIQEFSYVKVDNQEREILMEEHDYVIIDVRSEEEYDGEHIRGAINIPYEEIINANLTDNNIYFVYCMSGGRSKIAADTLIKAGYKVYDLGGIEEIDLEKE